MKRYFLFSVLFFCTLVLNAQSPTSFTNTAGQKIVAAGMSANNPWVGAQIGYKIGESDDFSDHLLVSGRFLWEIPFEGAKNFHLPVMGNLAQLKNDISKKLTVDTVKAKIEQALLSTQGIQVGLYPYYIIHNETNFSLTLHGVLSWKVNGFKDDSNGTTYMHQGKFSLGAEIALGATKGGRNQLVVSVAPTIAFFNKNDYNAVFGKEKSSLFSTEITGVVPLGEGLGLLVESILAQESYSVFRVGIILAASTN